MTPGDRLDRLESLLERHVEFVGKSIVALTERVDALTRQVDRTAAAQEVTEQRLQHLIDHVDRVVGRIDKLEENR